MRVGGGNWPRALTLVMAFAAAVLGVQCIRGPAPAAQADANAGPWAMGDGPAAVGPLTPQIDCDDPPPGERARLVDDAEMAIAYRGENHGLWYSEVNQFRDSGDLNWLYDVSCEVGPDGGCKTIKWPAIAMARDAEDRYRPVLAFRDSDKRVAFTVLTSDNSEFASHWYATGSDVRGDDVRWIDIAAGNLDGPWTGDTDDEVAIAFSGNDHVLHVLALDPENLTPLEALGYFWNSDDGRGNVQWTAVATGDLDGDGYDNEIVVAFRDGDGHLQVVIVRKPDEPGLAMELLWSKRWTDHDRDNLTERGYTDLVIDVATGDIDADWQDEVVVAFRDGSRDCWDCLAYGKVQLLVLDPTGTSGGEWVVDDSVWITWDRIHFWSAASVSVAVADLDGDGTEEIALGCTIEEEDGWDSTWSHALRKYEYADGALVLQDDWRSPEIGRNFSPSTDAFRLALAAGDSNRDGRAEVVTAYRDTSFDLHLRIFDARNKIQLIEEMQAPSHVDDVREVALAMGDADLNALYGTYKGAPHCFESEESSVTAVIHSPPNWLEDESNHDEAAAGFGTNVGNGGGTGETVETTIGGSVTTKVVFEEIGPSVTVEWEGSTAHENVQMTTTLDGSEFETHPIWVYGEEGYLDAIGYVTCPRWCYEYVYSEDNSDMTVCLPRPSAECAYALASLDRWYAELSKPRAEGGVGESWVPVGMNLARSRPAWQSSTAQGGDASRAVDGNTDGDYANGSVTHTHPDQQMPAWEVDLGRVAKIHAVQLWNRTDCCGDRLADFYVFVSEEEFISDDPEVLAHDPQVWHTYHPGPADRLTLAVWSDFTRPGGGLAEEGEAVAGRHVRVQLTGANVLSLAEVQVWGVLTNVDVWPIENPGPTAEEGQFTITLPDGSPQIVDGTFVTARDSLIAVGPDGAPSFNLGTETEWEEMTETGSETTSKVGMEMRIFEAEFTAGIKNVTSLITTWSSETEFSGEVGGVHHMPQYKYAPYIWLQEGRSFSGVPQAFLVIDYWVPWIAGEGPASRPANSAGPSGVVPMAPLVASLTHPDPNTWYESNAATFTWEQPPGDPSTVAGYRWLLDRSPDTVPVTRTMLLTNTDSYEKLEDGVWTLHVRAQGDGGEWSETGRREIRIDAYPPQVTLTLEPSLPTGHGRWYNTPVTATVTASDAAGPGEQPGSGVSAVEVSTDGLTWQPYAGPLTFDSETAGTTLWARAADVAGHVSEPVSSTFQIDLTPPSSHTPEGPTPGALYADVWIDEMGNEHPILAGRIEDPLSGQLGMDLEVDGLHWTATSALGSWYPFPDQPDVEVTWYYTGTSELGRGYHIFDGHAVDQAGNVEETYELARLLWFPQSAPDLQGSIMGDWPEKVRPGDVVYVVIGTRNTGYQEAYVEVSDAVPVGLTIVESLLPNDVVYDPETRTATWPVRLMWPGEWHPFHFRAQVDEGVGAVDLVNQATAHAFWPNTDELPPDDRQRFEELERTVELSATITVEPDLPPGVDVISPLAELHILSGEVVTDPQVELLIRAVPDTRWMYLREWALDPGTGEWVVAQDSGWLSYHKTYPWTLTAGTGVRYVGVWVADGAGNVSTMWELSMAHTNLMGGTQSLVDGQRHQYRLPLDQGNLAIYNLVALQGDPDLYAWYPRQALRPNQAAEQDQLVDVVGFHVPETGVYLLEVLARGDSQYELFAAQPGGEGAGALERALASDKERPPHPMTVSDPLGAGVARTAPPPEIRRIYLPVIYRND